MNYEHAHIFSFALIRDILKTEVIKMAPTEAQIRARRKYREKQEYLQTRVSPEEKATIAAHTESIGESLSEFIRRAIFETITRDQAVDKGGNE